MPERIDLEESLFPVQAFFNAVSDDSFVRVVESLTKGIGYCVNECDCSFPDDLDPDEETFEGVRFSIFEQSVVIPKASLLDLIKLACDEFVKQNPEKQGEIEKVVAAF